MAAKDKPFRLMDLAPELRTRIYECYFEPEGPQTISIFDITKHAPSQAITAVNKRMRHETYKIGKDAEREFFQRSFFLEWCNRVHYDGVDKATQEIDRMSRLIEALPLFPITTLEVRLVAPKRSRMSEAGFLVYISRWSRHVVNVDSTGFITETVQHGSGENFEEHSDGEPESTIALQYSVRDFEEELTRGGQMVYLDIVSVIEAALVSEGWTHA
ncbi:hypothetical protein LTR17_004993 [Elasticomyces elasticus]|nr:hypothetical protein LTR17_004993 [Elasticomyces elasticus]